MLETFRKHHYIMMCLIAVVVIVSFTFFFNPNSKGGGGPAGSGAVFTKLNGADLTTGEIDTINQLQMVIFQTAGGEKEGGREFAMTMGSIVDEAKSRNRNDVDPDYAINVFIMRQECERLGIAVEKEDVEKRIQTLSAFQNNGRFDGARLEGFLTSGQHGDKAATQTKLVNALRDVMMFQRLSQLVGGSWTPSAQQIDSEFASQNESTTVAYALVDGKQFENQPVTDEEIQKYYDEEKAKKESTDKAAETDPIVLTEEKRTVQYCITQAPASTAVAPVPPQAPRGGPPAKPETANLPEDQKKAKEEEWKKQDEAYKAQQDAYAKALAEYTKANEEYIKKKAGLELEKRQWQEKVAALTDAIVAEPVDRAGKTFAELSKIIEPPAPAAAPAPVPVPAPAPAPLKPLEITPTPAPVPTPTPATPVPVPTPEAAPKPGAAQGAQGPAGKEGQPSTTPAPVPAESPAPAVPAVATPPAEATPAPVSTPAPAPVVTTPPAPPAPLPFLRTATFTSTTAPPEIQIINGSEGPATAYIFRAAKGGQESWVESSDKNAYLFFVVTDIVPPALRPLAEVKEQISKKLKEKKVAEALKAAGDSARSNLLEALKGGKSFKEAAEAAKTVPTELPAFSRETPLPPGTPNAGVIRMVVSGRGKAGLQAGEVSDPQQVPEGLLLVYAVKKELPKYPDTEDRKKKLRDSQSLTGAGKFDSYQPIINPVFKSWFAARRSAAQTATP